MWAATMTAAAATAAVAPPRVAALKAAPEPERDVRVPAVMARAALVIVRVRLVRADPVPAVPAAHVPVDRAVRVRADLALDRRVGVPVLRRLISRN